MPKNKFTLKELAQQTAHQHIHDYFKDLMSGKLENFTNYFDWNLEVERDGLTNWLSDNNYLNYKKDFETAYDYEQDIKFQVDDYHTWYMLELKNFGIGWDDLANIQFKEILNS